MAKLMLIDATHSEETRVAVVQNNKLQEFDFETKSKPNIKSNIYLAKVIRVEPSLQAAFVEFGKNRHGFLAFSEIHPDYYRIPVGDRDIEEDLEGDLPTVENEVEKVAADVEILGGEDAEEFPRIRSPRKYKHYKIQEVIKRRQIMLVQVIKEERQSKRAAVTTYLSLAGRYCVLMPNAGKGGGISRKITDTKDRKRLKSVIEGLELPEGMGMIVRTAGMDRTKGEIKRDFDYLLELWDEIRGLTLKSIAPTLIHAEGALITRAIRDLYTKDIDRIIVEGEAGYEKARNFIRRLIPSHIKKVELYKAEEQGGLFQYYNIEDQIDAILSPTVPLPSGGYIIINPTEALISIDVNSGRSTRERHIEETALKTNLEAAEVCAQQLRLRNLAGLVVIDFIDMEEQRNILAVERRLKEAMSHDKARLQIGRISSFGLLELTRQRLRPSVLETSMNPCPHCHGVGLLRSSESLAIRALRSIEKEIRQKSGKGFTINLPTSIASYLLNHKRFELLQLEEKNDISLTILSNNSLLESDIQVSWENVVEEESSLGEKESEDKESEVTDNKVPAKHRKKSKGQKKFSKDIEEKAGEIEEDLEEEPRSPHRSKSHLSQEPSDAEERENFSEDEEKEGASLPSKRRRRRKRRRDRFEGVSLEGASEEPKLTSSEAEDYTSEENSGEEERKEIESLVVEEKNKDRKEFYKKRSSSRFKRKFTEGPKTASLPDNEPVAGLTKLDTLVSSIPSLQETNRNKPQEVISTHMTQETSSEKEKKRKGWWQRLLK